MAARLQRRRTLPKEAPGHHGFWQPRPKYAAKTSPSGQVGTMACLVPCKLQLLRCKAATKAEGPHCGYRTSKLLCGTFQQPFQPLKPFAAALGTVAMAARLQPRPKYAAKTSPSGQVGQRHWQTYSVLHAPLSRGVGGTRALAHLFYHY